MASTISITYKLQGNAKELKELINSADGLKNAFQGAAVQAEQLPKRMNGLKSIASSISKSLGGLAAAAVSARSLIGVMRNAVGVIQDFEKANSVLASVLGKSAREIEGLTQSAADLGRTTSFTATEVTELQTALARLGFTETQITSMQESVLKFAAAVGTDLSSAADFSGAALRAFGLKASDAKELLDLMAASTSKSALSFSKLQTSISVVAPVANAFGLSARDTVSILGVLSNAGFDASSAATALRNILLSLADSNGKLVNGLGHTATTMPEIINSLQELKDRGVDLNTTLEMTDKRSVAAFNALVDVADDVRDLYEALGDCNGALDEMYKTMEDNVEGATRRLQSAWQDLALAFRNDVAPALKSVYDWLAKLILRLSDAIKTGLLRFGAQKTNRELARYMEEYKGRPEALEEDLKKAKEGYERLRAAGGAGDGARKVTQRRIWMLEEVKMYQQQEAAAKEAEESLKEVEETEEEGGKTAATATSKKKGLTDAIKKYKEAVEGAVAANAALGGGTADVDAKLKAMESGLQSLIKTYGAENGAVKALIQEYNDLAAKRREANKATSILSVDELKGLKGGVGGTSVPVGKADTNENKYKGLTAAIRDYRESVERAVQVNAALGTGQDELSVRIDAMESGIRSLISRFGDESEAVQRLIKDYNDLKKAKAGGTTTTKFDKNGLAIKVPAVSAKSSGLDAYGKSATKAMTQTEALQTSIGALGGVFRDLAGAVGDSAAAWLEWGSNLMSAIAQALPQLTALFVKQNAAATANTAAMATGAGSSVASIPYVGPVLAIAAIASVLAAIANLPKFAKGGVITGPTMGLMGEYHGAVNNPEVVAPLNTLRQYIQPAGIGGEVDFRIRGRDLRGVIRKDSRRSSRS